ncbi:ATP-binding cassette domain-containing protein [Oenococcus sicerae]|uniref:ATP-binding cassette domain-containing protein n=1 Tax=Oenococcus sicerae TaxID=2203724 RepID=A0ABX5QL15_9LACO|nr:ATP-binding cassette domain-containing protein [Oenococcus sicerae]
MIITLLLTSDRVISSIKELSGYTTAIKSTRGLRKDIIWHRSSNPSQKAQLPAAPELKIDHLSFGYGQHPIFKDLNLLLPYGSKLMLSGDSGSGKTTFLNLLTNNLPPTAGSVHFGGQTVSDNQYAYITQESWVFDASVKDNL